MMPWTIENHNDVGPDPENECFVEWWTVTDGEKEFKCDEEEDAQFLAGILNGMMDQKPAPGLTELAERLAESHGWRKDGKWVACTYPAGRKAELDLVCAILNSPSVPSPGLVGAAKKALVAWMESPPLDRDAAMQDLGKALAECGEWERATTENCIPGGGYDPEMVLGLVETHWPNAVVMRPRGKKEEGG